MKKTKTKEINKNMSFEEAMRTAPESAEVLLKNGMHCFGCMMARAETIEQGAMAHGVDPDKIVKEINDKIAKKKK